MPRPLPVPRALLVLPALLAAGDAAALDFRSLGETAVLYDAPSQKGKPLYVAAAGTPVEAVVTLDAWVKVRDIKGDLAWIERRLLTDKRMLQLRGHTTVRTEPGESAAPAFEAEADVLLEYIDPAPSPSTGWIRVRHRDGSEGYVKAAQVWGL